MSGRIRSIKPEILEDAVTAGLSDTAFRIFIAVIVLADDYGRFRAEPGFLRGQIFWSRDVDPRVFAKALEELKVLAAFYCVNEQRYGEIRNWSKHQRVDKPGKPRIPPNPGHSGESREIPGNPRESLATDLRPTTNDQRPTTPELSPEAGDAAEEVWTHYLATVKVHRPKRRPTAMSPKDRKAVKAHLRSGLTVFDLKRAVEGLFRSTYHLGMNDRSTEYLELEYALRKPGTFIAIADDMVPIIEPITDVRPTVPDEYVDPALIDAALADLDRRFAG